MLPPKLITCFAIAFVAASITEISGFVLSPPSFATSPLSNRLFQKPSIQSAKTLGKAPTPNFAGQLRASSLGLAFKSAATWCSPLNLRWLAYKLQQALVGPVVVQVLSVIGLALCMIAVGAVLLRIIVPHAGKKHFSHWLLRSYVMLNRVSSQNPMAADSRREKVMNNILFNLNILTISIMTGIVAASAKTHVERIINGNLPLVERGHTVLLVDQWNEQVVPIVQQMQRMASFPEAPKVLRNPIAILSNLPKARVTAMLEEGLVTSGRGRLRVLVRQGDPRHAADLAKVCVDQASKVMLLTPDTDRDKVVDGKPSKGLVHKIRQETSLLKEMRKNVVARAPSGTPAAVVAVPGDGKHWQMLEKDFCVCEDQEFVGRLIALCTVESSSGLSEVYNTLLKPNKANFFQTRTVGSSQSGYESLVGLAFDQLQEHFPRSTVCGIVRNGNVMLSPQSDVKLGAQDAVLVYANKKDDVYATQFNVQNIEKQQSHVSSKTETASEKGHAWSQRTKRRIVVLGWNERGRKTLTEIAAVSPKGSEIVTLSSKSQPIEQLPGVKLSSFEGDLMSEKDLSQVNVMDSDCIVCLFDSSAASNTDQQTDSQLLATIHAIGKLPKVSERTKLPRLVAMVHSESVLPLLQQAAADADLECDFILSKDLESGALVQVLMRPDLEKVFNSILSSTGRELLVLPITRKEMEIQAQITVVRYSYVSFADGATPRITFRELQTRARQNGQVALGILKWHSVPQQHELILNPPAKSHLELGERDRVVFIGDFKDAYLD